MAKKLTNSTKKLNNLTRKCNTCNYCKILGSNNSSVTFCDYLCMTGTRRGCEPENCDKYEKRKKKKPKLNF